MTQRRSKASCPIRSHASTTFIMVRVTTWNDVGGLWLEALVVRAKCIPIRVQMHVSKLTVASHSDS